MARFIPLGLILIAFMCILIAALIPASKAKGQVRLLGSLFVGTGFCLDSLLHLMEGTESLQRSIELLAGAMLIWLGSRKYRRDPEGRTPPASIL